jgi:hypothetical protein
VAGHLLHGAQVGAVAQHVGAAAVAQAVLCLHRGAYRGGRDAGRELQAQGDRYRQKPEEKDLLALAQYTDVLILPSPPASLDSMAWARRSARCARSRTAGVHRSIFACLLTRVPSYKRRKVDDLRKSLRNGNVRVFESEIPRLEVFDKAAEAGVLVGEMEDEQAERAAAAYAGVGKELLDGKAL